jgi:hypothetical protein
MNEGENMASTETATPTRRRRNSAGKRGTTKAAATRTRRSTRAASPGGLIATMRRDLGDRMGAHTCTDCNQPHSAKSKASVAREIGVTTPTLDKFLRTGNASGPTIDAIHGYLNGTKS